MADKCDKCGGTGYIAAFAAIANGECFRCLGEGVILTAAERTAVLNKRVGAADRRMAREQGVSVETVKLYCGHSGIVPRHPNGYSYSIQEFETWLKENPQ